MQRPPERSARAFQVDALDGLRGLAVLTVFLSHTSNNGAFLLPYADFAGAGKSGVFLFFLLSSFLLTYPFVRRGWPALSLAALATYLSRRVLRIYPLYTLYLLAALATTYASVHLLGLREPFGVPFDLDVGGFVRHMLLEEGQGVTWSIAAEFAYYFVLPVVAVLLLLLQRRLLPTVLLVGGLIAAAQAIWPQSALVGNDPSVGPYLGVFLLGSLLAVLQHHWTERGLGARRSARRAVEAAGLLAALALFAMTPSVASRLVGRPLPDDAFHQQVLLFGGLWAFVLFACVNGAGPLRRVFELRPLRYLGRVSFSVYLIHIVFIVAIIKYDLAFPGLAWAVLAATLALSHLSYLLVERPFASLRPDFRRLPTEAPEVGGREGRRPTESGADGTA